MKNEYQIIVLLLISLCMAAPASSKTVFDQLGREVTLPDNPKRIVSLAPNITEIIYALDQAHRLKGVTQFSDFPEAAKNLPRVGSYVHLDIEKIVAIQPDLCIATKDGNPKSVIDKIESFNIPVYAVDPRNLESIMETLLELGELLDAVEKADVLVRDMQNRINKITAMVNKADNVPRVFFQIGISPIVSVGTDTFIHELIIRAGGENLSKGPIPYPRFSKEQILALSPDIFIVTSMVGEKNFGRVKTEWSRWPDLPAVKNDRILLVDSNIFDRPTPRLVDALEFLAKLIHPELFNLESENNRNSP